MSNPQSALPPAGWYPDPSGAPQQRWWDGQGWTVHYQGAATAPATPVAIVAPASAPVQVPVNSALYQPAAQVQTQYQPQYQAAQPAATLATSPGPSFGTTARRTSVDEVIAPTGARALEASSTFPLATTPVSPAVPATSPAATAVAATTAATPVAAAPASAVPATGFDFSFSGATGDSTGVAPAATAGPFGITDLAGLGQMSSVSVLSYEQAPTQWSTRSGWLLALLPLVQLAITGGMLYLWVNVGLAPIAVLLLSVLPAVLSLAAVISDQRKLRELGFDRPPSWAWIFLGAWLYLILRAVATRREMGAGSALIWVWLASSIIATAAGSAAVLYFSALYAA